MGQGLSHSEGMLFKLIDRAVRKTRVHWAAVDRYQIRATCGLALRKLGGIENVNNVNMSCRLDHSDCRSYNLAIQSARVCQSHTIATEVGWRVRQLHPFPPHLQLLSSLLHIQKYRLRYVTSFESSFRLYLPMILPWFDVQPLNTYRYVSAFVVRLMHSQSL